MQMERLVTRQGPTGIAASLARAGWEERPEQHRGTGAIGGWDDPRTMTAEERCRAVAAILAAGILRVHTWAASPAPPDANAVSESPPESRPDSLAVCDRTVLSGPTG
jgi:hypothetical protein